MCLYALIGVFNIDLRPFRRQFHQDRVTVFWRRTDKALSVVANNRIQRPEKPGRVRRADPISVSVFVRRIHLPAMESIILSDIFAVVWKVLS